MPRASAASRIGLPAKLVRPGVSGAIRRERLFGFLEAADAAQIVWIRAQAGAGKTLLAAGFIEARRLPSLWYQLDAGDADPGTFFYYAGLAAGHLSSRRGRLPLLTAEYRPDPVGFARNFARAMFARLPPWTVLVLEDFHELPAASATIGLLPVLLEQTPPSVRVLITSRGSPPPELARLVAHSSIRILDNPDLRLTLEETQDLLAGVGVVDAVAGERLHRRTDGWVAGAALLARHLQHASDDDVEIVGEAVLAGYFESEVFDKIAPSTRELLLRSAWLPQFTAEMAEAASGISPAAPQLAELGRQHGFVSCSGGAMRIFRYHDLFRAFLIERASRTFAADQAATLVSRCAGLLQAQSPAEAFELYLQVGDHAALLRLIADRAEALLAQGRGQMLADWLERLPPALIDADPWLTLWGGMARMQLGLQDGRPRLMAAYRRFEARGDVRGAVVAATAFVESVLVTGAEMQDIDPCIESLQRRLLDPQAFPSQDFELRVIAAVGVGLGIRRPADPQLPRIVARARQLITLDADPNVRAAAANFLIFIDCWFGIVPATTDTVRVMSEVLRDVRLVPVNRLLWHWWIAQYWFLDGNCGQGLADLQRALDLAQRHGLDFIKPILVVCQATGLSLYGEVAEAAALLLQVAPMTGSFRPIDAHTYLLNTSLVAHAQGDSQAATASLRQSLALSHLMGSQVSVAMCGRWLAVLLADEGRLAEASGQIAATFALLPQTPYFAYEAGVLSAYAALQTGNRDAARHLLAECPQAGRRYGYPNFVFVSPRFVGRIAALAFQSGIDTGHFRALVRRLKVLPPDDMDDSDSRWPWPIRIHTMGRFEIEVAGEVLRSAGKSQKRPLELLKALIAHGSRDVAVARLVDQIWPDAEGDAAQNAFHLALHRLRRLLGEEAALILQEGRLSIDSRRAWVDVRSFERLAARITEDESVDLGSLPQQLLDLYAGPFLQGEEAGWIAVCRDRMRSRFVRAVLAVGTQLSKAGRHEAAMNCFERAIELEPAAEPLHRALLECLIGQGRHAEALQAFERCRMLLHTMLGAQPSRETMTLTRPLTGAGGS